MHIWLGNARVGNESKANNENKNATPWTMDFFILKAVNIGFELAWYITLRLYKVHIMLSGPRGSIPNAIYYLVENKNPLQYFDRRQGRNHFVK